MPLIADILDAIDAAVAETAESGFAIVAGEMGAVVVAGSAIVVGMLGANVLMQLRPMTVAAFFSAALRIVLIAVFALSWSNFANVYDIISQSPQFVGGLVMVAAGPEDPSSLYQSLDGMLAQIAEVGTALGQDSGWMLGAILTGIFYILVAVFAAVAAGVIAFGLIVFTVMIVVAPFFITLSLFGVTRSLFDAWVRSTLGYAMIPLAAGGVLGVIATVGETFLDAVPDNPGENLGIALPFITVMVLSLGVMATIPAIAQGLAGTLALASNAVGLTALARSGLATGTAVSGHAIASGATRTIAVGQALRRAAETAPAAGVPSDGARAVARMLAHRGSGNAGPP
ncbi:MAG: type IV secretion system protein [Pseudomonadota bacterium]